MVNLRLSTERRERREKRREREKCDYHRLDRIYVYTYMCILLVLLFFLLQTYIHIHRHSMAMSRRKQLHPKSLKGTFEKLYHGFLFIWNSAFEEGDETVFVLPDELKCDEEVWSILLWNLSNHVNSSHMRSSLVLISNKDIALVHFLLVLYLVNNDYRLILIQWMAMVVVVIVWACK